MSFRVFRGYPTAVFRMNGTFGVSRKANRRNVEKCGKPIRHARTPLHKYAFSPKEGGRLGPYLDRATNRSGAFQSPRLSRSIGTFVRLPLAWHRGLGKPRSDSSLASGETIHRPRPPDARSVSLKLDYPGNHFVVQGAETAPSLGAFALRIGIRTRISGAKKAGANFRSLPLFEKLYREHPAPDSTQSSISTPI